MLFLTPTKHSDSLIRISGSVLVFLAVTVDRLLVFWSEVRIVDFR